MNDMTHQPFEQPRLWDALTGRAPHPRYSLLVYGTLKRGCRHHTRFCRNAVSIHPATTWGRLYDLPAGYPALEIPKERILARGTADPQDDANTQVCIAAQHGDTPVPFRPIGDWNRIHGELITFDDPSRDLPPIDHLEGFMAGRSSLYQRVLTYAVIDNACFPAWVYIMQRPPCGLRLSHGRWDDGSRPFQGIKPARMA